MSDFSRAGWFDNTMNQAVTEQIVKEARCAPRSVPPSPKYAPKECAKMPALAPTRSATPRPLARHTPRH